MARAISRLLYAILVGLVGAGIVHAIILLILPYQSARDAWSRLAEAGDYYQFVRIASPAAPIVQGIDPSFDAAACRFDLADGVVHVHADGHVPFWSVSVYDRRGHNIYSLNDRTASHRALDLVLVTPAQMIEVRKNVPAEFERSAFVEADVGEGIVAVRAYVPDLSWATAISAFLDNAQCELR